MNPLSSLNRPAESPGISYSDVRSLQRIDTQGEEGIKAAAQQFESLFIGMMLKSMREANAVFAEGNPLSSPELTMHQEMLDHQYSIHMAESGGIGLAEIIEAQLRGDRRPADAEAPAGPLPLPRAAAAARQANDQTAVEAVPAGPAAMPTQGSKAPGFASREAFVAEVLPQIERAVAGTPLEPLYVLAQSALETGWGQRMIHGTDGTSSNNLFGIKAGKGWQGDSVEVKTLEVTDGRVEQQTARFRAYPDVLSAVRDYVDFLQSDGRYREVLEARGAEGFAQAIGASGYATDPGYASKVSAVIDSVKRLIGA